jgi:hypothetical protein
MIRRQGDFMQHRTICTAHRHPQIGRMIAPHANIAQASR